MPVNKKQGGLAAKYGQKLDKAVQKHAEDSTSYGMIRLPGGINNGIARLKECYFKQYEKGDYEGEYYFRAVGIVYEPDSVTTKGGTQQVQGLQTSIMLPVCDTKNQAGDVTSQEQHIEDILNEMRKLAGEEFTKGATGADLESLAASIQAARPFFRFSTSEGKKTPQYPEPRVWENWHGSKGLEDYSPPDERLDAVQEEGQDGEAEEQAAPARKPQTATGGNGKKTPPPVRTATKVKAPEPEPDEGEATAFDDQGDIDTLVSRADEQDDEEAKDRLKELAMAKGVDEEEVDGASSWADVAKMILGEGGEAEEATTEEEAVEEEEATQPAEWEKGDAVSFRPLDPATKKRGKPVDCEIEAIDKKSGTCTLKSLVNPKIKYHKVKVADIEAAT